MQPTAPKVKSIYTKGSAFNLATTVLDDQNQSKIYLLR